MTSQQGDKGDGELEGGCDFMVIGYDNVILVDVISERIEDGMVDVLEKSRSLRTRCAKLILRICIRNLKFKMPKVQQLLVFSNVSKSAESQIKNLVDCSNLNLMFEEDLKDFAGCWKNMFKTTVVVGLSPGADVEVSYNKLKQTMIGIWSMDNKQDSTDIENLNRLLGTDQTVQCDGLKRAVTRMISPDINGEMSPQNHRLQLHGPLPTLDVICERHKKPGTSNISGMLGNMLAERLKSGDHCLVNLCGESLSQFTESMETVSQLISLPGPIKHVTCLIDLSQTLKFSTLRTTTARLDREVFLSNLLGVVNKTKIRCSLILTLSASETPGSEGYQDFGLETFNQANRAYFNKTKTLFRELIESLVPVCKLNWYDCDNDKDSRVSKGLLDKLNAMFVFPDKQINRETISMITQEIQSTEKNILHMASKINGHKSAAKSWGSLGNCHNDDLKGVKNSVERLQGDLEDLLEVHARLGQQIGRIKDLYGVVHGEVEANIE